MGTSSAFGEFAFGVSPFGGLNPWLAAVSYYPTPPAYGQSDFLAVLQAYMPRGKVWPRDPGSVQTAVLSGLAAEPARVVENANALLQDAFPATTVGLLSEWQAALGQPDSVGPVPATIEQAQQFVVAKLTAESGQSVSAFVSLAAAYGVQADVTECAPFRAGQSSAGATSGSEDWWYAWYLNLAEADGAFAPLLAENAPAHLIMNVNLT
jgi:uncharacterized protein YmfQ (DUF2313 family)